MKKRAKIKMHRYLKIALAVSAVLIPLLNWMLTSSRPRWSVGGEICILPFAIVVAGFLAGRKENK